jgi:hypothetical protein
MNTFLVLGFPTLIATFLLLAITRCAHVKHHGKVRRL